MIGACDPPGLPFCTQPSWQKEAHVLLEAIPRQMYQYLHLHRKNETHQGVLTRERTPYAAWGAPGGLAQAIAPPPPPHTHTRTHTHEARSPPRSRPFSRAFNFLR